MTVSGLYQYKTAIQSIDERQDKNRSKIVVFSMKINYKMFKIQHKSRQQFFTNNQNKFISMSNYPEPAFCIHFRMKRRLRFGEALYVSGDIEELGCWQIGKALRLTWNDKDIWTGTLILSNNLPGKFEYKYFVSFYQSPNQCQILWQQGKHNRLIQPRIKYSNQIVDDKWNMDKISLNLMVPQNQDLYNKYSVIGNHIQLGNWRVPVSLSKRGKGSKFSMNEIDTDEDNWEEYNIYSYSFQIFRGREKFRYYYIRQANYVFQAQRHPGRLFTLGKENSFHPDYFKTVYNFGKIQLYEKCNFHLLVYSQITDKIFLGAYPKTVQDIKQLRNLGVNSILSIQTQNDFLRHGVSQESFRQVCKQQKLQIEVCSIKDMDKEDFLQKAEGALQVLRKWSELDYTIYVHCSAGIYRSPQIVIMHLVIEHNYDLEEAIKLVKHKHAYANPNTELILTATDKIKSQKLITSQREISFIKQGHLKFNPQIQEQQTFGETTQLFQHH